MGNTLNSQIYEWTKIKNVDHFLETRGSFHKLFCAKHQSLAPYAKHILWCKIWRKV